jgi:hypothetical protein
MKNKLKGHKSWKNSTLFQRALKAKNEDKYWDYVVELRCRGTTEIYNSAKDLCFGSKVCCRQLGADILSQLGYGSSYPFRNESLKLFHKILKTEKSPKVLESVLVGIGHLQKPEDTFGVWRISSFRNHKSEDVREGVVFALLCRADRISVSTLVKLSRDKSPSVRDWATFGLSQQIDLDTPGIRKALIERINDSDYDTRGEALLGLAKRKDPRVKPFLIQEFDQEDVSSKVIEAAAAFGDKTLLPYIEQQIASVDEETDDIWLYIAIESRDELKNS